MRLTWIVPIQGRRQTGFYYREDFIVYKSGGSKFISRQLGKKKLGGKKFLRVKR